MSQGRQKLIARHAEPGQYIRTMSGAVMLVTSHDRDNTHLKTTVERTGPNGVEPAGSYDSVKSIAPIQEILDQI